MGFNTCAYLLPEDPSFVPAPADAPRLVRALLDMGAFVPHGLFHLQVLEGAEVQTYRFIDPDQAAQRIALGRFEEYRLFQLLRHGQSPLRDRLRWAPDYGSEPQDWPTLEFGFEVFRRWKSVWTDLCHFEEPPACKSCHAELEPDDSPWGWGFIEMTCPECGYPTKPSEHIAKADGLEGEEKELTYFPAARTTLFLNFDKGWAIELGSRFRWTHDDALQETVERVWGTRVYPMFEAV